MPFQPGLSGNPAGKPKGTRNKTTLAVEAPLDGEAETLTRKAIELAKAGDLAALRVCLDRIAPPRKDRPVLFELPLRVRSHRRRDRTGPIGFSPPSPTQDLARTMATDTMVEVIPAEA
jgi:Family of unknown function (DUF5681)